jgi:hypothetical protein
MSYTYSLNDINVISINNFEFILPKKIEDIISKITEQINSPSYIRTPTFIKGNSILSNTYNKKKNSNKKNNNTGYREEWSRCPALTTTTFKRNEGIDLKIDELRSYLNKITDSNYDIMKQNILNIIKFVIKSYLDDNNTDDDNTDDNNTQIQTLMESNEDINNDLNKIVKYLFSIASTNIFYSKLYAKLYSDLSTIYPFFNDIFQKCLLTYMNTFIDIQYVSPDIDYNKFCEINASNTQRRALSLFFINLNKCGKITNDDITILMKQLAIKLIEMCKNIDDINIINEIVENMKILYENKGEFINDDITINGKSILEIIEKFSNENNKINPGISMKTKFVFYSMLGK